MASGSLASTLYRAILSSAKRYGEGAQRRCLPARKELEIFNSVMKSRQLPLPTSGIMNSQLATSAVQTAFRQPTSESQETAFLTDAFAILRKLRQKAIVLTHFPTSTSSECITDGCKVDAKSRYLWERANGWHFWDYTVRFYNNTERTVQLVAEKLRTKDENLNERHLEFALLPTLKTLPVIKPGEHFEFTKRMVFRTRSGSLSGSYMLIDVNNGDILHAKMSPILLTANTDEEMVTTQDASVDGDEETKNSQTQIRDGARRRRLRREEEKGKTVGKSEGMIPDSELKTRIRRGLYHSQSSPSFPTSFTSPMPLPTSSTPLTSPERFKPQKPKQTNSSSSRKRAIQRATPITTPIMKDRGDENSETEETNSNSTPLLEPEGGDGQKRDD